MVAVNKEPQGAPRRLSGWQPNAEVLQGGQGSSCRKTGERTAPGEAELSGDGEGQGSPINRTVVLRLCSRFLYNHSWTLLTALRGRQGIHVIFISLMRR